MYIERERVVFPMNSVSDAAKGAKTSARETDRETERERERERDRMIFCLLAAAQPMGRKACEGLRRSKAR